MIKNCVNIAEIMMPSDEIDLKKWSVVACDQYTSQPDYWKNVEKFVGDEPSTLKLILPEIYLEAPDVQERISKIYEEMNDYASTGKLKKLPKGIILTERYSVEGGARIGVVASVDLEAYDYNVGSTSQIRPTEKTVVERIPPRLKVRSEASLESPHIMLIIDDEQKSILEPLFEKRHTFKKIYDTELMQNSGSIKGYFIDDENILKQLTDAFENLADSAVFSKKYNTTEKPILQFAVGDGNHSMATAKAHWENIKKTLTEEQKLNHPARFALCEIVNMHDETLLIEPIHRVIFGANFDDMIKYAEEFYNENGAKFYISEQKSDKADVHQYEMINGEKSCYFVVENPKWAIPIATLQNFIDFYETKSKITVDYIHGEDVVNELSQGDNFGFILPDIAKNDIFKGVVFDGVLPKKTFSMGHAFEKRFYIEVKNIK